MPDKLTDAEIKKALECIAQCKECCETEECQYYMDNGNLCDNISLAIDALDLINRQEEKIKKFENRQKPTGASGYKIENGKVVFFTNMLGGCKIVKENLEEVVKTLNELLQEAYSKDEIAFALKSKTEELDKAKAEVERLKNHIQEGIDLAKQIPEMMELVKAEAYKEFAERLEKEFSQCQREYRNVLNSDGACAMIIAKKVTNNLLNELVGDLNGKRI